MTEVALTLEENLLPINIANDADKPLKFICSIRFHISRRKLFALRDRLEDEEKDFGAYHAFDIYRVIAMMTEKEWNEAIHLCENYRHAPKIIEAAQVVGELFPNVESIGVLRVQQHARAVGFEISPENIVALIEDIHELLAKT